MGISLDIQERAGIPVVFLIGEIGHHDEDDLLVTKVGEILVNPGDKIILDMSQVTYLNSTGISTLVRLNAQANVQEQRMVFTSPSHLVEGLFHTTQLVRFFEVFKTIDDAVADLQQNKNM